MRTYDSVMTNDMNGNAAGVPFEFGYGGHGCKTHDGKWVDSSGAFLVGELERLDQTLHDPLSAVSWGRDIDLREDVTIADEVSSFTQSTYGSAGGLGGNQIGNGKAWIGKASSQITGVGVDIAKTPHPLRPWGIELKYTILELESAAKMGRPVDQQKYEGMKLKHQMDIDEQVYIGDFQTNDTGLLNDPNVTPLNFATGTGGFKWSQKTADEILVDFNFALTTVWQRSAWAVMPSRVGIPPAQYGYISTAKVSTAGNVSIKRYVEENNLLVAAGAARLTIVPMKWCLGAGAGGTIGVSGTTDRMIVYTKDKNRVRYPMTMLQRTPVQYESIFHKTTYFCRLGCVEVVYPETMGYFDGL